MIEALETLLKDLMRNFNEFGMTDADGKKFDPNNVKLSELKEFPMENFGLNNTNDSHQQFYDPAHCDNILSMPKEHQEAIAQTWVDAHNTAYSQNVGRALWNTAVRAYYMANNVYSAIPKIQTHMQFTDNNNKYLDDQRVLNRGEIVEGVKTHILSRAPLIVDERTLTFGKSYQKFIDAMANNPDPLADIKKNGGWMLSSKIDQGTANAKAGFITTKYILDERIARYEARLNENLNSAEDEHSRQREVAQSQKTPALATREKYYDYFELVNEIETKARDFAEPDDKLSYQQKIATLQEWLARIQHAAATPPTPEAIKADFDALNEKREALSGGNPEESPFLFPENYQTAIYVDMTPASAVIKRITTDVMDEYNNTLAALQNHETTIKEKADQLAAMTRRLTNLIAVLAKLDNLKIITPEESNILATDLAQAENADDTIESLRAQEKALRNTLLQIEAMSENLNSTQQEQLGEIPKIADETMQQDFTRGFIILYSNARSRVEASKERHETALLAIENILKEKELMEAKGNAEKLAAIKKEADSALKEISIGAIKATNTLNSETKSLEQANLAISDIEHSYHSPIEKARTDITAIEREINDASIETPNGRLTTPEELKQLQTELEAIKVQLKTAKIPLENEFFETLKNLLNWDESTTKSLEYIKAANYGYTSWGWTFVASSPLNQIKQTLKDRLASASVAMEQIQAFHKQLISARERLNNLNHQKNAELTPQLATKEYAEELIKESKSQAENLAQEKIVQENKANEATQAFEQQLQQCLTNINDPTLTEAALRQIKSEFDRLEEIGKGTFDLNKMPAYQAFTEAVLAAKSRIMPPIKAELIPGHQEHGRLDVAAVVSAQPAPAADPPAEQVANNASLFNKYFSLKEDTKGLATRYLEKRAAQYTLFDTLQKGIKLGIRFFSGGYEWKTDQDKRTDYLAHIATCLERYEESDPKNISFLKGAYNLSVAVFNENLFPARAKKGSDAYSDSMRALLEDLIADIKKVPGMADAKIASASEEEMARNQAHYTVKSSL